MLLDFTCLEGKVYIWDLIFHSHVRVYSSIRYTAGVIFFPYPLVKLNT
jgi:hypothetical protein